MTETASKVVDNPGASRFEVLVADSVAGFAEYHRSGPSIAFTHTVIEPGHQGHGLGSLLAKGALNAASAAGASVLPFCPFIRGYIQRHPAYLDLVPADRRAQFALAPASDQPDRP